MTINSSYTKSAPAVHCYLDESATDGSTQIAVVGGIVTNSSLLKGLDSEWMAMITDYPALPSGIHMKDFGRDGPLRNMPLADRLSLFERAVSIIEKHSIYTLATTLEYRRYQALLPDEVKSVMSMYAMTFMGCVIANREIALNKGLISPIAYKMDSGNPYAKHVCDAHLGILRIQDNYPMNVGSLDFEDDEKVPALQAADLICWASRRKATDGSFKRGYRNLEALLSSKIHIAIELPDSIMSGLLEKLA